MSVAIVNGGPDSPVTVEDYLSDILAVVLAIRESQAKVESMVLSVSEKVDPVLQAIATSPLGGMLGI